MEELLFDQVGEAVISLAPSELGEMRTRAHRRGIKVWFGPEKPTREHFEAQVMPRRYVDGTDGIVIEIGFHTEHREAEQNLAVVAEINKQERRWRKGLGKEAEVGVFFGADNWRRVSEVWVEPDLDDPELAFEIAARLVDYLVALEPILSADGSSA